MPQVSLKGIESDLDVSTLVLGTDYFGTSVEEDLAFSLIERYIERGGNCLDTARFYADWMPGGHDMSERTLGRWLAQSGRRDDVLLSTKGGHPPLGEMHTSRVFLQDVRSDIARSRELLGSFHIDLYWLHRDDEGQPVGKIMDMLAEVASEGGIGAFGASNWRLARIIEANEYARKNGLPEFAASQIQWSLAVSSAEAQDDDTRIVMDDAEFEKYVEHQFPVLAYTAQAKGFFSRPLEGPGAVNDKSSRWFTNPTNLLRKGRVQEYARQHGVSPSTVALSYVTDNRIPGLAMVGCRNLQQLDDSMDSAEFTMSLDDIAALEAA